MHHPPAKTPTLSCQNLSCHIAGRTILHNINLDFGAEQMTAIVGINGAGKSTLLRALAGISAPTAGQVLLADADLSQIPAKRRAQQLAYVAQNEVPPAEMKVHDFVSLGRLPYQRLLAGNTEEDQQQVSRALELVDLIDVANRSCGALSGGQRRRVCLARAIAQDAPILMLDEPTNHLDVRHQQSVLRLAKNSGSQVIAAIHDLDLVMSYFDRVIIVHQQSIVADGAPAEVLSRDLVAHVFRVESCQLCSPRGRTHLAIESELTQHL